MSDEKPKPGRPRKWSSDAERMRAHRAAKREKQRADDERRSAAERHSAERATAEWSPAPKPEAPATNLTTDERPAVHGPCETIIEQLREEVERLEAEFDEVVYDRWTHAILWHRKRIELWRDVNDVDRIAERAFCACQALSPSRCRHAFDAVPCASIVVVPPVVNGSHCQSSPPGQPSGTHQLPEARVVE